RLGIGHVDEGADARPDAGPGLDGDALPAIARDEADLHARVGGEDAAELDAGVARGPHDADGILMHEARISIRMLRRVQVNPSCPAARSTSQGGVFEGSAMEDGLEDPEGDLRRRLAFL